MTLKDIADMWEWAFRLPNGDPIGDMARRSRDYQHCIDMGAVKDSWVRAGCPRVQEDSP